ncbi:MAG: hypothetical protein V8S24_07925 [Gordonibacter pamelaeae]
MVQKASVHQGGIKRHASPIAIVGRIASVLSVCMYVSYLPQIMDNLAGHPGNPVQPLAAFFNCLFWAIYGLFERSGTGRSWWPARGKCARGGRALDCRLLTPPRCPPAGGKVLARMANVSGRCVARKQVKQA